jgi:hypothetical protein
VPEASSDEDNEKDDDKDNDKEGVSVEVEHSPPPPPWATGEVSSQIYNGQVIRDDTDDMIGQVAYHCLRVAHLGQPFDIAPELTKEEKLAVDIIVSAEKEKRAFLGYEYALALSVVSPPASGPWRCNHRRCLQGHAVMRGTRHGTGGMEPCHRS